MFFKKSKKVAVVGSGAWGSAIANLVAKNNFSTVLIGLDETVATEINQKNTNHKYLPDVVLSPNLKASTDINSELKTADFIFIVVPSQNVKNLVEEIKQINLKKDCGFIICTKGLESESLKFFHEIIKENFMDKTIAVLSGPTFAIEVAQDLPTVCTISSKDKKFGEEIIEILENEHFKAIYCDDLVASEICGIVKNIIAIACGICEGLELGQNAKAAIIVKGISEIEILCNKIAGSCNLNTPAGFGDLFLTCSSTKSRNNSLGFKIGKGESFASIKQSSKTTYEGATSASSIDQLAKKLGLKLELCHEVNEILTKNHSIAEIKDKIVKAIM